MGCCISSDKKNKNRGQPNASDHHRKPPLVSEPDKTHNNRAPPPTFLEEETVKEVVLSETPLPKPPQDNFDTQIIIPIIPEHSSEAKDLVKEREEEVSQVSQVSDIYSVSVTESFSTTADKRDDEAISKPTTRETDRRSPAEKVPRKRAHTTGEIISRGAISPAKKPETSRSTTGRTMSRRNVGSSGTKRETGRRSRSPATTRTAGGVGRSPGKVTGRAGGRVRVQNEEKKELSGGVLQEGKKEVSDGVLQQRQRKECNGCPNNPNVSLELECFIFL